MNMTNDIQLKVFGATKGLSSRNLPPNVCRGVADLMLIWTEYPAK